MKELRKRCVETYFMLSVHESTPECVKTEVDTLEAFAREIRNEALEKAAKITENRCGTSTIAVKEIRALKTDALAANMNTETAKDKKMKNMKEESKKFVAEVLGLGGVQDIMISKVEAFARSIRNEALEKAAKITENRCGTSTIAVKEIRALKTDAEKIQGGK